MNVIVKCKDCLYSKQSFKPSYYGNNGYNCMFGIIPKHYVLDENGTCTNGKIK